MYQLKTGGEKVTFLLPISVDRPLKFFHEPLRNPCSSGNQPLLLGWQGLLKLSFSFPSSGDF